MLRHWRTICQRGEEPGQLEGPSAVIGLPSGLLCVSDTGNDRVQEIDHAGNPGRTIDDGFDQPTGVACDADHLYVVDRNNHRVRKFRLSDFAPVGSAGAEGSADGQLSHPVGVAVADGILYVADNENHRICAWGADALDFRFASGSCGSGGDQLRDPTGLAYISGHVYICDTGNARVQVMSPTGEFVRSFGKMGVEPGEFRSPYGIAAVSSSLLIVSEFGSQRVQLLTIDGAPRQLLAPPDANERSLAALVKGVSLCGVCSVGPAIYAADYGRDRLHVLTWAPPDPSAAPAPNGSANSASGAPSAEVFVPRSAEGAKALARGALGRHLRELNPPIVAIDGEWARARNLFAEIFAEVGGACNGAGPSPRPMLVLHVSPDGDAQGAVEEAATRVGEAIDGGVADVLILGELCAKYAECYAETRAGVATRATLSHLKARYGARVRLAVSGYPRGTCGEAGGYEADLRIVASHVGAGAGTVLCAPTYDPDAFASYAADVAAAGARCEVRPGLLLPRSGSELRRVCRGLCLSPPRWLAAQLDAHAKSSTADVDEIATSLCAWLCAAWAEGGHAAPHVYTLNAPHCLRAISRRSESLWSGPTGSQDAERATGDTASN